MNWPSFGLVCRGHSWQDSDFGETPAAIWVLWLAICDLEHLDERDHLLLRKSKDITLWFKTINFRIIFGALQENPVRALEAITVGALTGQGPIQETIFGELFSGALQENPVIAPGQLHEKMFIKFFW